MKSLIESLQREFVEEENVTGTGEVYSTPNAFSKTVKDPEDDAYSEIVERIYNRIYEVSYKDYKGDSERSDKQKINGHVAEINKRLREVEQMLNHASKLKLESGSDQGVFWKGTFDKFQKIDQRLNRLSNKIREINT